MKKIVIIFLLFLQLFFCVSCKTVTYSYFDFENLAIEHLEIGYIEEYYPEDGKYGQYEAFLIIKEETEKEALIKDLSSVKLSHRRPQPKYPFGNCVKIVLENDSYYIISMGGTAEYSAEGIQKTKTASGQGAMHLLVVLSKYVELKEDGYWSQESLEKYRSSLQEN